MLIPCRHIVAIWKHLHQPSLEVGLFDARYLIDSNIDIDANFDAAGGIEQSSFDWISAARSQNERTFTCRRLKGCLPSIHHNLLNLDSQRFEYHPTRLEELTTS